MIRNQTTLWFLSPRANTSICDSSPSTCVKIIMVRSHNWDILFNWNMQFSSHVSNYPGHKILLRSHVSMVLGIPTVKRQYQSYLVSLSIYFYCHINWIPNHVSPLHNPCRWPPSSLCWRTWLWRRWRTPWSSSSSPRPTLTPFFKSVRTSRNSSIR